MHSLPASFPDRDQATSIFPQQNGLASRRILVTGGAGFLGSAVVRQLCHAGAQVTVLDNFSSGRREYLQNGKATDGPKVVVGDICDPEAVGKSLVDAEVVIHLAALPFVPDSYFRPKDFFRTNVDGTINMLLTTSKSKSVERFVYISSSEVYGSTNRGPMDETHPTLPHSSYAASKLAADRVTFTMSKEIGLPAVIVRPFNCYGPNITQPYIVPEIIAQAGNGNTEVSLGNTEACRDLTYVDDTARGIMISAMNPRAVGEVINLGSGSAISVRELALRIASLMGKRIEIKIDPSRLRPYDVEKLICDNSKAMRILGWKPRVALDEGLRLTIDWVRNNAVHFQSPFSNWYRENKITPLLHANSFKK